MFQTIPVKKRMSWSFRPILIWIRWIGIDIREDDKHKSRWQIYGLLCLLFNLACEADVLNFLRRPELYYYSRPSEMDYSLSNSTDFNRAEYNSITSSWNGIIDFTNYAVHSIGSQLLLLTVIRPRWGNLMAILKRCESQLGDAKDFYVNMRKMSIFGVIYVIVMVS